MNKLKYLVIVLMTASCSYKPIVDHRGLQGKEVAYRYNDDLETCKSIAKDNTNNVVEFTKLTYNWYVRPSLLWLPDELEYTYEPMVKKCLTNRGHSILQ